MIKTGGFAVLFAVSLGYAATVYAAPGPAAGVGAGQQPVRATGPRLPKSFVVKKLHLRELDLTNAQRRKIRRAVRSSRRQSNAKRRKMNLGLRKARNEFWAATPGTSEFRDATKTLARVNAKNVGIRTFQYAQVRLKIRKILTPAQQAKVAELRK